LDHINEKRCKAGSCEIKEFDILSLYS